MHTLTSPVTSHIDLTLLKPEATLEDIVALTGLAQSAGVYGVCVSPTFVAQAKDLLAFPIGTSENPGKQVKVVTVIGFPSGAHTADVKALEANHAVDDGADEIDMVINIGAALAEDWAVIGNEISAVRHAAPNVVLKVILETAALPAEAITKACRVAEENGADYVKTSTGFHPAGGATVEAVTLMANAVGGRLGIKASGGIRTMEQAEAFMIAGADRLGMSSLPTENAPENPSSY